MEEYARLMADSDRLDGQLSALTTRARTLRAVDPSGPVAGTLKR
jgi:hypothetical protein